VVGRDAGVVAVRDPAGQPADEASICVECGLCCDGTVVSHLAVRDESDLGVPLAALGVTLLVEADPPVFALPCPALHERRCSVYDLHRPSACGLFECAVSSAVAAGTMARADARAVIAETVSLRDRVRAGEEPEDALRRQVARHFRPR
jgi:Fe-S-cluster containining protein